MPSISFRLFVLCLLLSLLVIPRNLPAQESNETLTLQRAIELALENNRTIKSAELDVLKSSDSIAATRTKYFPSFSLTVLASQLLTPIDFTFEKGLFGTYPGTGPIPAEDTSINTPRQPTGLVVGSIQQPLSQIYRISMNVKMLKAAQEATMEEEREKKQAIVNDVKKLYYGILQSESALTYAKGSIQLYRELDRVTDEYLIQRVALKSDSLQVKSQVAKAEYDLLVVENELSTRKEELNVLLGRDIRTEFSVTPASEETEVHYDLATIQTQALENRPELREARHRVKQAQYDKRAKKAEYIPDVSLSFNYLSFVNYQFIPNNMATAGIYVSWDAFDWGRKKNEIAEKERSIQQAKLALTDGENKILAEVNSVHRKLTEGGQLVRVARLGQEAALEVVRITANKYKEKAALLKDVFQAQTTFEENKDRYQQALLSFWSAKADLEKAVGEDQ